MSDGSQKQILFFLFEIFFSILFQIVIASWWITSWKVQREREKKNTLIFIFSKSSLSLSLSLNISYFYIFLYEKNKTNVRLVFSCWMREEKPFKVKYSWLHINNRPIIIDSKLLFSAVFGYLPRRYWMRRRKRKTNKKELRERERESSLGMLFPTLTF